MDHKKESPEGLALGTARASLFIEFYVMGYAESAEVNLERKYANFKNIIDV